MGFIPLQLLLGCLCLHLIKFNCPRDVKQPGTRSSRSDARILERPGEHLWKFCDSGKLTGDKKKKAFHALHAVCDLIDGVDDAVNEDDAAAAEDNVPVVADDDDVSYQANTVLANNLFDVFAMSKE